MRHVAVVISIVALVACDTMIASRLVVKTPRSALGGGEVSEAPLIAVREILTSCGLREIYKTSGSETWVWEDHNRPPGIHAEIIDTGGTVEVRLAQGLYGPIGPTAKYREVRAALVDRLRGRFGRQYVRLE